MLANKMLAYKHFDITKNKVSVCCTEFENFFLLMFIQNHFSAYVTDLNQYTHIPLNASLHAYIFVHTLVYVNAYLFIYTLV